MVKFSVKVGWKHALLEKEIRQNSTPDASRSDILKSCINVGWSCTDWTRSYKILNNLRFEDAPQEYPTSWQCPITDETASAMEEIKVKMLMDLNQNGIIVQKLQQQYVLQLLMANLVENLKEESLKIKEKETSTSLTIPDMASIFTELILTDRDSDAILKIKNILVDWRKNNK